MKKTLAMILALAMLFGVLSGCGTAPAETEAEPKDAEAPVEGIDTEEGSLIGTVEESDFVRVTEEGTLTIGTPRSADRMEPGNSSAATACAFVYETLFTRNSDNEIVGLLAEEWEWTDDTTLRIKLHDGITFSNGEPCTSSDVLFSLQRLITSGSRMSAKVSMIDFDNCEIIDDTNFTIKYTQVYGPALTVLSSPFTACVCQSYVESMSDEDWWDKPVGTGPYVMTENISGDHASFVANENYWGGIAGQPCVDSITLRFYTDTTTMLIDYENGVLDIAFEISSSDAARVLNGEVADTNYCIASAWDAMSLAFPTYVEALQDVRVRQAIAYAIDAEAVGQVAYGVLADTDVGAALPPVTPFAAEGIVPYGYDVEKARELLAETDYADGFELTMAIVNSDSNQKAAEAIQSYLAEIGITVNIEAYDRSAAIGVIAGGGTDLAIHSWGEAYDPDNAFANLMSTGTNMTIAQTDEQLNEWVLTGQTSVDDEVRAEAYANVQQWLNDNCVVIPLCYVNNCAVYRPYVTELYAPTMASPDLRFFNVE